MEMLERLPGAEIKFAPAAAEAGEIVGYASTFGGSPDAVGDVVMPGAISRALAQHKAADTRPALLWGHDLNEPLGVWDELAEDAKGLRVRGRLNLELQRAREVRSLALSGALAFSIGFIARKTAPGEGGARRKLIEVDLLEVSIVAVPANPAARIVGVKSIDTIRDFEAELRDVLGFTQRQAKRLAAGGWPALHRDDDSAEALRTLARDLERRAAELNLTKG